MNRSPFLPFAAAALQRATRRLRHDEGGAIAVTYALALTGLLASAGVSFDYARMVALSSEMHNAADQAALAAATQLDGSANAITYATQAASNLVGNKTVMANDSGARAITVAGLLFYGTYADAEAGTNPVTDATKAKFVRVAVNARKAYYAYTPIVGLLASDDISAAATAGLGSSICKVPPVFMCNPYEATDPGFTVANYIGKGLKLIANTGGSNYAPGNFGYLESNAGNGANAVAQTLGNTVPPGDCISTDTVTTKPGQQVSVLDALNTRMDVYANGLNNVCGSSNASCPASANARKDLEQKGNGCAFTSGNGAGWQQPNNAYAPSSNAALTQAQINSTAPMGYPRDICHAVSSSGVCSGGQVGDGVWDSNAYFKTNTADYASSFSPSSTFGTSTPTRYQVYKYEAANAATRLVNQSNGSLTSVPVASCGSSLPVGGATVDRRVLSVAVIDCTAQGVAGRSTNVAVTNWIDVFLVEPSVNRARTSQSDVYVEVIGPTQIGGGGDTSSAQIVRISKPYLVN
ncbi:pilus assembly protein TadG-related protein [Novosphingobium rosa]|uniref:pilus assembly protein TadG-related protein n=1 Tax=Novosphingobium rosa TaxID=76978 RepID=UPI0008313194|nr:pilus assembly protein TadG-related protein [Novosphingobium rosa]